MHRFESQLSWKVGESDKFLDCHALELFAGLFAVVFDEKVDNALFESQFDGDVLTKNDLAFKYVLVNKHQLDAGHEVFKFLVHGQGTQ